MIASIIQYFRSCYQADLRAVQLLNFLSSKVLHARLEQDPAWTSHTWHRHPVPTHWGAEVHKHLLVHGKEQDLYAGAFMLVGRTKLLGKSQDVCAPLYLIPVGLTHENEVYSVALDLGGMVINPTFADVLQQQTAVPEGNLYQQLAAQLLVGSLGFEALKSVEDALKNLQLPVQFDNLYDFPQAIELNALKKEAHATRDQLRLLPVLGFGVLDKQSGSLGILNELEAIAAGGRFSPALEAMFSEKIPTAPKSRQVSTPLPVTLSVSQEAILKSSAVEALTVVNGPPGTGKSFTIAAIAATQLAKGETVLIAAKNIQAIEVIADKLERDFHLRDLPVRATQKDYRHYLRRRLGTWLRGGKTSQHGYSKSDVKMFRSDVQRIDKAAEQLFTKARKTAALERQYGAMLHVDDNGWWQNAQQWWTKFQLDRQPPLSDTMQALEQLIQEGQEASKHYLAALFHIRLRQSFKKHRREIKHFWEALKNSSGNEKEAAMEEINFSKVLGTLPVWLVNSANVHKVLPLKKGLFDLVIIDEASQSDIASALPLLQRAKRAVIVGDPNQLRHISFLSRDQQHKFAEQYGLAGFTPAAHLSFRDTSILDLAFDRVDRQTQVQMLDEHFRSLPGIIAFSNRRFYDSALKIMTATPQNVQDTSVFVHQVSGKRTPYGQNEAEAAAIIEAVKQIVEEDMLLDHHLCRSIGLLSPFRGQTDLLKRKIETDFEPDALLKHRLLVGSPFDFQGEERDVMFLSWTVDTACPAGVFSYLNREDVFNVSITRARSAQHHYLSMSAGQIPANYLLRDYLFSLTQNNSAIANRNADPDVFMQEIIDFLAMHHYTQYWIHYPIAGIEIDLVVATKGQYFCIDLVGYPGMFQKPLPLERWKMLGRIGMHSFTITYSQWLNNRTETEGMLLRFLRPK